MTGRRWFLCCFKGNVIRFVHGYRANGVELCVGWPIPYIHMYVWYIYGAIGWEFTIHTVIYDVHVRFWPTLVT